MRDIARPALAEVLAATTERDSSWWRSWLASPYLRGGVAIDHGGVSFCARPDWRHEGTTHELRWLHASPAEAVEALETARLWPREPGDDPTRWWCERCQGCGWLPGWRYCACALRPGEYGHTADPPSHAAIVAVASLGAGQLARYVALAGEIARAAGCAEARVVWRVMGREAIEEMRKAVSWGVAPSTIVEASIQSDWYASDPRVASSAWSGWRPGVVSPEINEVMPMLRDLHAGGVRLVGLDASRIVLAVEAIGGDRG